MKPLKQTKRNFWDHWNEFETIKIEPRESTWDHWMKNTSARTQECNVTQQRKQENIYNFWTSQKRRKEAWEPIGEEGMSSLETSFKTLKHLGLRLWYCPQTSIARRAMSLVNKRGLTHYYQFPTSIVLDLSCMLKMNDYNWDDGR